MKKLVAIAALAAAFAAPGALAGETPDFAKLDADASGGLSLAEIQAAKPEVTAEKFAAYDIDASGELSETEFATWVATKAEKKTPESGASTEY